MFHLQIKDEGSLNLSLWTLCQKVMVWLLIIKVALKLKTIGVHELFLKYIEV